MKHNLDQNVEQRPGKSGVHLTTDLARNILDRHTFGPIIIVVDRPIIFLSILRKQWLKLGRQTQIERARTIDAAKITLATQRVSAIYTLKFCALGTTKDADIFLISPTDTLPCKPTTFYFCSPLTHTQREFVLAHLSPEGQAIDYTPPTAEL